MMWHALRDSIVAVHLGYPFIISIKDIAKVLSANFYRIMKIKNNLHLLFYTFGILGVINAGTKSISDGLYTSGLINKILFYPFSFLPLSSLSFFIISGILDLSIIWLVLGYFFTAKNKSKELNKPSTGYKVAKWLLLGLVSIFVLIALWGVFNFLKHV